MEENIFNKLIESLSELTNEQRKVVFQTIIPEFFISNPGQDTNVFMTHESKSKYLTDNPRAEMYRIVTNEISDYTTHNENEDESVEECGDGTKIYNELFNLSDDKLISDDLKGEIYHNAIAVIRRIASEVLLSAANNAKIKTEWETVVNHASDGGTSLLVGNYQRYLRDVIDTDSILNAYPVDDIN